MTDEAIFTLVTAIAVCAVMMIPSFIARRGRTGEARFDNTNKEPAGDE